MRAEQFDDHVIALARALRRGGVQHVLLEDDDIDSVTVVPGPSRRNVERLVKVLRDLRASGRVPGERETLPVDYDALVKRGHGVWPLQIDGAAADILLVPVESGRFGRYYEAAELHSLEQGLTVAVVRHGTVQEAPVKADARRAMPELELTQRDRDRARMKRRAEAAKAERRAQRAQRGRRTAVPSLSAPRTFGSLRDGDR